mmetsp:Transcript_56583/g.156613  ORF Transcript_56583/g.156613 Transcript_56583/m.156613 type:complete len:214 (-) Transcript_56583:1143-1784(-)
MDEGLEELPLLQHVLGGERLEKGVSGHAKHLPGVRQPPRREAQREVPLVFLQQHYLRQWPVHQSPGHGSPAYDGHRGKAVRRQHLLEKGAALQEGRQKDYAGDHRDDDPQVDNALNCTEALRRGEQDHPLGHEEISGRIKERGSEASNLLWEPGSLVAERSNNCKAQRHCSGERLEPHHVNCNAGKWDGRHTCNRSGLRKKYCKLLAVLLVLE